MFEHAQYFSPTCGSAKELPLVANKRSTSLLEYKQNEIPKAVPTTYTVK